MRFFNIMTNFLTAILGLSVVFSSYSLASKAQINEKKLIEKAQEKLEKEPLTKEQLLQVQDGDFVIGNIDAPVTIIEYASMTCSHCANFYSNVYKKIKEKYIDNDKVKFVFRHFPLNPTSLRASMLIDCVEQDKKAKFKEVLFSTQGNWANKKNYLEIISNISKLGGMSSEEFDSCISDTTIEQRIVESKLNAVRVLEVRSTPTVFINGQKIKNPSNFENISKKIDSLL